MVETEIEIIITAVEEQAVVNEDAQDHRTDDDVVKQKSIRILQAETTARANGKIDTPVVGAIRVRIEEAGIEIVAAEVVEEVEIECGEGIEKIEDRRDGMRDVMIMNVHPDETAIFSKAGWNEEVEVEAEVEGVGRREVIEKNSQCRWEDEIGKRALHHRRRRRSLRLI